MQRTRCKTTSLKYLSFLRSLMRTKKLETELYPLSNNYFLEKRLRLKLRRRLATTPSWPKSSKRLPKQLMLSSTRKQRLRRLLELNLLESILSPLLRLPRSLSRQSLLLKYLKLLRKLIKLLLCNQRHLNLLQGSTLKKRRYLRKPKAMKRRVLKFKLKLSPNP